jgi:hypothetical protein
MSAYDVFENGQPLCELAEFKVVLVVERMRKTHGLDHTEALKA